MLGLLLVLSATFCGEIALSIGKRSVEDGKQSIYAMGFLNGLWGTLLLFFTAFVIRKTFLFSFASLPTFGLRLILELAQAHVSVLAIARADRSTFGFLRILTIPLLLLSDVALGYSISGLQIAGMAIIIAGLIALFIKNGIRRRGMWLVLFTAVNAAATISLYKYNITHYNSVEAEQGIALIVLMLYFFAMARFVKGENPLYFLKKPIFLAQSLSEGVGVVLIGFAYLYAPASIITAIKRAAEVLWATVSGKMYFGEQKLLVKLAVFVCVAAGLVLLILK